MRRAGLDLPDGVPFSNFLPRKGSFGGYGDVHQTPVTALSSEELWMSGGRGGQGKGHVTPSGVDQSLLAMIIHRLFGISYLSYLIWRVDLQQVLLSPSRCLFFREIGENPF